MGDKLIKDTLAYRNIKKKCNAQELALLDYIVYLDERMNRLIKIFNSEQLENLNEFVSIQHQINDLFAYKLGLERDDQNGTADSPVEGNNGSDDSAVETNGD